MDTCLQHLHARDTCRGAQTPPPLPPAEERPSFGRLLADSLRGDGSTQRGWFDEERRYQLLQQSRCPLSLPQVWQPFLLGLEYSAHNRSPTKLQLVLQKRE